MLGAIAMAYWPRWNFAPSPEYPMGGMEFQVVLLLVLVYLFTQGDRRAATRA
jgi:putative oxidoreductase